LNAFGSSSSGGTAHAKPACDEQDENIMVILETESAECRAKEDAIKAL
jgi:hypothetical protein